MAINTGGTMEIISQIGDNLNKFHPNNKLSHFFGSIIMIIISILLANKIDHVIEYKSKENLKFSFLSMIHSDLGESLIDIERDLNNHVKAYREGIHLDSLLRENKLISNKTNWEFVLSDFQFYPNLNSYESLKHNGFEFTCPKDTIFRKIISLYELDFIRLIGLGKDKSNTKNIKLIWKDDIINLFNLDGLHNESRNESLVYTDCNIDGCKIPEYKKSKFILMDGLSKRDKKKLLLNIQFTNETRLIKINYYTSIRERTKKLISEIEVIQKGN